MVHRRHSTVDGVSRSNGRGLLQLIGIDLSCDAETACVTAETVEVYATNSRRQEADIESAHTCLYDKVEAQDLFYADEGPVKASL